MAPYRFSNWGAVMLAIFEQCSSLEPKCSTERYDDHNDEDDNNDDADDDSHGGYTVEGIHYRHANRDDDGDDIPFLFFAPLPM